MMRFFRIFWFFRLKPQVWKMLNSWSAVTVLTQASKQNGVYRDRVSMLWCQPCFQHVTASKARVIMVGVFMNYWIPRVKFHSRCIRSRGIICKTHRAWSELPTVTPGRSYDNSDIFMYSYFLLIFLGQIPA